MVRNQPFGHQTDPRYIATAVPLGVFQGIAALSKDFSAGGVDLNTGGPIRKFITSRVISYEL